MRIKNGKPASLEVRLSGDSPPESRVLTQPNAKGAAEATNQSLLAELRAILREELPALLHELHKQKLNHEAPKEWYTIAEFAAVIDRAEFTVRKRCRDGGLKGTKVSCRGTHGEWRLSHQELLRFLREGYAD